MKTLYTLIGCLFIGTFAQAQQNFSVEVPDTTLYGQASQSDFYGDINLYNNTSNSFSMRWVRIEESIPASWYTSVCDPVACRPPTMDSASFSLPVTGDNNINVHFYPENTPGIGYIRIKLYEVLNPTSTTILTYNGDASGAVSITEIQKVEGIGQNFPNPFNNTTTIKWQLQTNNDAQIQILDASGRLVKNYSLEGNQGVVVINEHLPVGMYFYRLVNNGEVISRNKMQVTR